jgi:predicted membrane protein
MQLTLFGDTTESGLPSGWTKETIVVGFGDVRLDLSKRPPGPDAHLTVFRLFGDVRITVPRGSAIQVGGVTLFGDRRVNADSGQDQVVRINISGVVGDVVIEAPPGAP